MTYRSLSLLILCMTGLAQAQSSNAPLNVGDQVQQRFVVSPRDGEFRKNWSAPGIACLFIGSEPPGPAGYAHCLRIGALKLGMEFKQLQTILGGEKSIRQQHVMNARVVNVSPQGTRTMLIPLEATDAGEQLRLVSYLVVLAEASGEVSSLQLTGKPGAVTENLPFSGIKLGSRRQHLIDTLGLPSSVADVPQIKGRRWDYGPFPFSIELVDGLVYSMRIHQPTKEDLQRAFRPLTLAPE